MNHSFWRLLSLAVMVAAFAFAFLGLTSSETPYGSVSGTLLTAEGGAPLPSVRVSLVRAEKTRPANRKPQPAKAEGPERYVTVTDPHGRFAFRRVAVGTYRLMAETRAHEQPDDTIAVREGLRFDAVFELKPSEPFLRLLQVRGVFTTREELALHCLGFVPDDDLVIKLYRVSPEVALAKWHGWLPEGLTAGGQSMEKADLDAIRQLAPEATVRHPIVARDVEGVFREEVRLGMRPPGMYVAAVEGGAARGVAVIVVTDLGLIVKASPKAALVYAVDLNTSAPAPGVRVELLRNGAATGRGTTDGDGLLTLQLPRKGEAAGHPTSADEAGEEDSGPYLIVGYSGPSMAVANLYGPGDPAAGALRVYTYTDRPVYRPGQKVYFKTIARELIAQEYRVPAPTGETVRVTDGQGNLIHSARCATGDYGSSSGEFDLPKTAIPGQYTLSVLIHGRLYDASFQVAEYRKPEFEVTVTPERKRYTRGETVKATVAAQYYFGSPVGGAHVDYTVTRAPSYFAPESDEWDEDLNEPAPEAGGEIVLQGEGTTDEDGRLEVAVPPSDGPQTTRDERGPSQGPADQDEADGRDQDYTIEATVTDESRRGETGSGSALVTQGEYRIEVLPEESVARPGQTLDVKVRAVDYDGHPIPGAAGETSLLRQTWVGAREQSDAVGGAPWRADAGGEAVVRLRPARDGSYRIVARSSDRRGNAIAQSAEVWVMGADEASFDYPYQDLDVRADKALYREGDTAEIVVNTRHAPQTALFTLEGAGIVERRLVRLAARSTLLKVPIGPECMSAARASVCFTQGKQFLSGEAVLNVSRERKALQVQVTSDRPAYGPGEKAVYRVRTLSPDGQPVQAEVSLGIVDEAVYAIEPESAPNIASYFYPKRVNEVQTVFSSPDVYLSGDDKAGSGIQTRRFFPDTSFWNPSQVTGPDGTAEFRVTIPDSLTTWRATCRAATLDTHVGQATADAVVRKPFLVRLEAPRFLTQGDEVVLAAIAHNLTDAPLSATVGLDAKELPTRDPPTAEVRIGPGKTSRVEWRVSAPQATSAPQAASAPVRVWASAGRLSDAMAVTLPILPKGRERVETRSGAADASETLDLQVRRDVVPGTQRLTVRLAPSLASAMLGALDFLASYPYGCAEQTMSSFLPDIEIARMLDRLGIEKPDLHARLPGMVQAGLLKLYGYQHPDGGWRWWAYDDSDPWMTAYVVFGLLEARSGGFPVTQGVLDSGIAALKRMAGKAKLDPDTEAYAAYVLALAGETRTASALIEGFKGAENKRLSSLSDWGRPMLALAMAHTGRAADAGNLLEPVWARLSGGDFSPHEGKVWRSDAEYAAAFLSAAVEIEPEDLRLPGLVRRLLDRREGDHWESTRDTAFALYGLSRYLALIRELQPDMEARVTVNGRAVAARRFTAADLFQPEFAVDVGARDLGSGRLRIGIEKTGAGRLYYTASLSQVAAMDLTSPLLSGSGLTVERSYRKVPRDRGPDGAAEGSPPGAAASAFASGDVIEVTLTVRSRRPLDYVMVEDRLPAGCEAPDRGQVDPDEWWYGWADQIVYDDKVGFALRHIEPGAQRIRYRINAQIPGSYLALPPSAYDMYNPSLRGQGAAQPITISPT